MMRKRRDVMPRTRAEWIAQYASSHRHPVNRALHSVGIPMIAGSIAWGGIALATGHKLRYPLAVFGAGWALQFAGHAFEGKRPEFMNDWRFLFVGMGWWWWHVSGGRRG
jgi:uncharacterized membrane protein YGL010W